MNKKILQKLKLITILCIIVLTIELCYMVFILVNKKEESIYFDGINALEVSNNEYITVGSNNDNEKFYEKAKITKYDIKKEKLFEKLYNKGFNSAFFGVAIDDDNYIAVGSFEKDEKDHKESIRTALLVKYDKDGNILFEKEFNDLDNSKFTNVVVLEDGYLVSGQSIYENTKVGNSKLGGAYLIKYSKEGKLLWKCNYGSNNSAIFNDLIVEDDYIYAVGKDKERVGIINKYSLDGKLLKTNDYKYTDVLGFSSIKKIGDYLYVATANRVDSDNTDAMIVKYDLDCDYEKQVVYESKGMERFNKIGVDNHNNLVVIGIKAILDKKKNTNIDDYNYDGIIAKYDEDLEKVAVVTYGDEKDDYFTDLKMIDDKYLVVGYSSYEDNSYLSKFIKYSDALKVLEIE